MRFDAETHTVHAAGRTWHADPSRTQIYDHIYGDQNEYIHRTRRCAIPFESGWTASIIWGDCTYSSNKDAWWPPNRHDSFSEEPATVEVGVLDHIGELRLRAKSNDEWHEVESYIDDTELAALLDRLATLPTDHDYGVAQPTIDEIRADYEKVREASGLALLDEHHMHRLAHLQNRPRPRPPWPTP